MSTACIEMATRLGKALAETPQAKAIVAAHKRLTEDAATMKLIQDHDEQAMKIARLEQSRQPVGPDDKHKLGDLTDKLVACEPYKQFLDAQVNYADLMRRVNTAIRSELPSLE